MPLSDRDYIRGSHPPSCTCFNCVNRRLGRLGRTHRNTRRYPKHSAITKQPNYNTTAQPSTDKDLGATEGLIIFSLIIMFAIALVGALVGGVIYMKSVYYDDVSHRVSQTSHNALGSINGFVDSIPEATNTFKSKIEDSEIIKTITDIFRENETPTHKTITPPPESSPSTSPTTTTKQQDYTSLFNHYRQQNGLNELMFTDDLNTIARLRLEELKADFSHRSNGGYNKHLAENINMISFGNLSNYAAFNSWRLSPGHNANMLDPTYKYTGYANNGGYAIQLFSSYPTRTGEPQLPSGWYWND